MLKFWRFTPSPKSLAILLVSAVAIVMASPTLAQRASDKGWMEDSSNQPLKSYVLMSQGPWTAVNDLAIVNAGGKVDFSHELSGIGVVSSTDPGFLKRALNSGKFGRGAEDMVVQWQEPANEVLADDELVEDVVTPGNDTFINLLWNMTAIEAQGAWSAGYDGAGVRVAVIDGGMCSLHPDVAPNLDVAASRSFVPGFNFDQDTGTPTSFRHACHVAGIIAAADNTIGTIGVAPRATIIGCKALHGGGGSFGAVIQAILYAADPISAGGGGANIINMSLSGSFDMGGGNTGAGPLVAAMNQAVNYANARNVLVVCSAGNQAIDYDHSGSRTIVPAQSGTAIAVSATAPVGFAVGWPNGATNFRDPASYTNFGRSLVWLSGPGGDSALPGNAVCSIPRTVGAPVTTNCWVFDLVISPGSQSGSYFFAAGTSMSAPHVAGVAALIAQKYPGISVGDLKTRLIQTADDEGEIGTDPFHGHGFVNARRAVTDPPAAQAAASPAVRQEAAADASLELVIGRNAGASTPSISFTMAQPGPARVELFDVTGRKLAVLFDGHAAGRTDLAWDGRDASGATLRQGAYFARLTANGVQAARKLVLVGQ